MRSSNNAGYGMNVYLFDYRIKSAGRATEGLIRDIETGFGHRVESNGRQTKFEDRTLQSEFGNRVGHRHSCFNDPGRGFPSDADLHRR